MIPGYTFLPAILCFLVNGVAYYGARLVTRGMPHHDFTTALDRLVPFHPGWSVIYLASYAFWVVGFVMAARRGREHYYRYAMSNILAKLVCGVLFLLLPTTNVRPEVPGDGPTAWLMRLIYEMDAPTELFPSIHCLESWFVYIGVRGNRTGKSRKAAARRDEPPKGEETGETRGGVPSWFPTFALLGAVLICASTQFTKQHYLVDIPAALLLAEGAWILTERTGAYRWLERVCERRERKRVRYRREHEG